jgi:hypothetical protein
LFVLFLITIFADRLLLALDPALPLRPPPPAAVARTGVIGTTQAGQQEIEILHRERLGFAPTTGRASVTPLPLRFAKLDVMRRRGA